jgi:hypothetical protein
MGNYLMTVKIKVDPALRAAALGTAQNAPVKCTGVIKIVNRKC